MKHSKLIKKLIEKENMSLRSFAKKIDIPYSTFHSILRRGVGKANVTNIIKICKGLGITVEELNNSSIEYEAKKELTQREKKLIEMYRQLPENRQLAYIGRLELELEQSTTKKGTNEKVI